MGRLIAVAPRDVLETAIESCEEDRRSDVRCTCPTTVSSLRMRRCGANQKHAHAARRTLVCTYDAGAKEDAARCVPQTIKRPITAKASHLELPLGVVHLLQRHHGGVRRLERQEQ
jgi:hypothetical protein